MTAMQLFTAIPKYYGDKISIKPERVERFGSAGGDEDQAGECRGACGICAERRDSRR